MDDLVTWLRAQLDEDEQRLWDAEAIGAQASAIAHDQLLADIGAKRRILDLHSAEPGQHPDFCGHDMHELPCPTVLLVALPMAERDGYHEKWRP